MDYFYRQCYDYEIFSKTMDNGLRGKFIRNDETV